MLTVEMLPACDGDCLVIRYGPPHDLSTVVIDGGRGSTYPYLRRALCGPDDLPCHVELLVITHLDDHHVQGALELLGDERAPITYGDIWFNGYDHHLPSDVVATGMLDAERVSSSIRDRQLPWNQHFSGESVDVSKGTVTLPSGMRITILSPDPTQLAALTPVWHEACGAAGLIPGLPLQPAEEEAARPPDGLPNVRSLAYRPFSEDKNPANLASIALVAEFEGRRMLFAGDAGPGRVVDSLAELGISPSAPLELDLMKVACHGSQQNTSRELLEHITCAMYAVSTDCSRRGHPDPVCLSRIIEFGGQRPEITFNYATPQTLMWGGQALLQKHKHLAWYPQPRRNGYAIIPLA